MMTGIKKIPCFSKLKNFHFKQLKENFIFSDLGMGTIFHRLWKFFILLANLKIFYFVSKFENIPCFSNLKKKIPFLREFEKIQFTSESEEVPYFSASWNKFHSPAIFEEFYFFSAILICYTSHLLLSISVADTHSPKLIIPYRRSHKGIIARDDTLCLAIYRDSWTWRLQNMVDQFQNTGNSMEFKMKT